MTMPITKPGKWLTGVAALTLTALTLSGCGSLSKSSSDATGGPCKDVKAGSVKSNALKGVTVKVGSKEFDEQLILGQLTVKMMCAAGATVVDNTNTKGSTADPQEAPGRRHRRGLGVHRHRLDQLPRSRQADH